MASRASSAVSPETSKSGRVDLVERIAAVVVRVCAAVTVVVAVGILLLLLRGSWAFFAEVGLGEFLFTTRWSPLIEPRSFGVLPLLWGSGMVVVGSACLALPLGMASALYLSEYAAPATRSIVRPALEVLAGIPTVVYGFFALTVLTPLLRQLFPGTQVFNAASASIVVGMMTLPMVASLCDDALRSVPIGLREAAFALGATRFEVSTQIVLPAARRGTVAAFVLATSRAIGETMAVTLAAGATPRITANYLEGVQTVTSYIVQVSLGDAPSGSIEYKTLFAVGTLLFAITLLMNVASYFLISRRVRS